MKDANYQVMVDRRLSLLAFLLFFKKQSGSNLEDGNFKMFGNILEILYASECIRHMRTTCVYQCVGDPSPPPMTLFPIYPRFKWKILLQ